MLIDHLLPQYEFSEHHQIAIAAGFDKVYAALSTADIGSNRLVNLLLWLRSLPARLRNKTEGDVPRTPRTLRDASRFGFFVAAENPPVELVIALQGKFWKLRPTTECIDDSFLQMPVPSGQARAVWNFSIRPTGLSTCILSTETRIHCGDASARRRFRMYWMLVRPGSGIIRRMMLRAIRSEAEKND